MDPKEGKIFIYLSCFNCGAVVMNGWTFNPKEENKTTWKSKCPHCNFPFEINYEVK